MRTAAALARMAGLSESVHARRVRIVAFQTLCKQKYLAEGESVPFLIDGAEVLVLWPDGGQPRAFVGRCPHEGQSLVNNSDFNGRILVCTVHGWVFSGRNGEGLSPTGCRLREFPLRLTDDGRVEIDLAAA
ncbi:MAG: Rieske 2Fe-2S domain-containing protein [Pseudomonadota bacterium]|nr:Rieske 2Fe-2S domain-containing protein [Pseudomonadota bacterium]